MIEMLRLAGPVALSFLGLMLMGVVDLHFVGKVSPTAIGAVGLGTSIFSWFMIFGIGLLTGLDYLVSYSYGEGKRERGFRYFVQGTLLVTALSLPMTGAMFIMADHLDAIGIHPGVIPETSAYLKILGLSLWPALLFTAFRLYLQAMGVAVPALIVLLGANVINALGNYAWVQGHWGFASYGAAGSAAATLVSRVLTALAMGGYAYYFDRRRKMAWQRSSFRVHRKDLAELIRLGTPSALQMSFEVGVFALSTTIAARLAPHYLAAHQVVLNTASMTFMVPLGIGSAAAVLVGQNLGRKNWRRARRIGWLAFALGAGFMACSGVSIYFFKAQIISIFTQDPAVTEVAASVMLIAALFQLSDGIQTVGTGALRGLGDTRSPMLFNLLGHWAVGLPLGLWLCFTRGHGLFGLWIGLSVGLTLVAASVLTKWWLSRGMTLDLTASTSRRGSPSPH